MQGGAGCCRAHIVDPRQEVEEPRAVVEAARVGRRLGGADEALRDRVRVGGRGRGRGRGRVRARVRVGVRVRAMVRVRVRARVRAMVRARVDLRGQVELVAYIPDGDSRVLEPLQLAAQRSPHL